MEKRILVHGSREDEIFLEVTAHDGSGDSGWVRSQLVCSLAQHDHSMLKGVKDHRKQGKSVWYWFILVCARGEVTKVFGEASLTGLVAV